MVRSDNPVQPDHRARRWPWAVGAAVLGASGGAGLVLLLRRWLGQDAEDAQDPDQLRAVVDRGHRAA